LAIFLCLSPGSKAGATPVDLTVMTRNLFPNGRHDDQVDSTAQFLDWFKRPFPGQGIFP
jgi:hypothetical protein